MNELNLPTAEGQNETNLAINQLNNTLSNYEGIVLSKEVKFDTLSSEEKEELYLMANDKLQSMKTEMIELERNLKQLIGEPVVANGIKDKSSTWTAIDEVERKVRDLETNVSLQPIVKRIRHFNLSTAPNVGGFGVLRLEVLSDDGERQSYSVEMLRYR